MFFLAGREKVSVSPLLLLDNPIAVGTPPLVSPGSLLCLVESFFPVSAWWLALIRTESCADFGPTTTELQPGFGKGSAL